jgi:hypothetical protein
MVVEWLDLLFTLLSCLILGLIGWVLVEVILIFRSIRRIALRVEALTDLNTWISLVKKSLGFFNVFKKLN